MAHAYVDCGGCRVMQEMHNPVGFRNFLVTQDFGKHDSDDFIHCRVRMQRPKMATTHILLHEPTSISHLQYPTGGHVA